MLQNVRNVEEIILKILFIVFIYFYRDVAKFYPSAHPPVYFSNRHLRLLDTVMPL